MSSTPNSNLTVNLEWAEKLKQQLGEKVIGMRERVPGEIEFKTTQSFAHDLLKALKELPDGPFEHLSDLTGYDESPKEPRYHVVYELISMLKKLRCSVVAVIEDSKNPSIATITDLWKGANWLEREAYDMYGIAFIGHPDLRRILMPASFKGYPLRKDFVVDYRQSFPEIQDDEQVFDPFGTNVVNVPKE